MNIQEIRARLIEDQSAIIEALEGCNIEGMRNSLSAASGTDMTNVKDTLTLVSESIDYHANLLQASNHMGMALDALERAAK